MIIKSVYSNRMIFIHTINSNYRVLCLFEGARLGDYILKTIEKEKYYGWRHVPKV